MYFPFASAVVSSSKTSFSAEAGRCPYLQSTPTLSFHLEMVESMFKGDEPNTGL